MKKTKKQNPFLSKSMDELESIRKSLNKDYKRLSYKRLNDLYFTSEDLKQFNQCTKFLILVKQAIKEKSF